MSFIHRIAWVESADLRPKDARAMVQLLTHYDFRSDSLGMALHNAMVLVNGLDPKELQEIRHVGIFGVKQRDYRGGFPAVKPPRDQRKILAENDQEPRLQRLNVHETVYLGYVPSGRGGNIQEFKWEIAERMALTAQLNELYVYSPHILGGKVYKHEEKHVLNIINFLGAHRVVDEAELLVKVSSGGGGYSEKEARAIALGKKVTLMGPYGDKTFKRKTTPPKVASSEALLRILRMFLKHVNLSGVAGVPQDAGEQVENGRSTLITQLLHEACRVDHIELVKLCLEELGASESAVLKIVPANVDSPLTEIGNGNPSEGGPEINGTAMSSAILGNSLRCVTYLLQRRQGAAEPEEILLAAYCKHFATLELLVATTSQFERAVRLAVKHQSTPDYRQFAFAALQQHVKGRNKLLDDEGKMTGVEEEKKDEGLGWSDLTRSLLNISELGLAPTSQGPRRAAAPPKAQENTPLVPIQGKSGSGGGKTTGCACLLM